VELSDAHDHLTALDALLVDVLVERSAVRGERVTQLAHVALTGLHERGRVRRVGGGGQHVEVGRALLTGCLKGRHDDNARAASDIQARALGQQVLRAVDRDGSGTADIDDPALAVFEEETAADLRETRQVEGLGDRTDTDKHDSVVVGVDRVDLVIDEQVLDQVTLAEFRRVHPGHLLRACGVTLFHEDPLYLAVARVVPCDCGGGVQSV
jgi:hypothetical protein